MDEMYVNTRIRHDAHEAIRREVALINYNGGNTTLRNYVKELLERHGLELAKRHDPKITPQK